MLAWGEASFGYGMDRVRVVGSNVMRFARSTRINDEVDMVPSAHSNARAG